MKILFRAYIFFFIILEFLFNFRFSSRNSQSLQKLAKKITQFTIQFCSKNLTHFTDLNDSNLNLIMEIICSCNTAKNFFWFYKCFRKHVSGVITKHFHWTISGGPRTAFLKHFQSKCLYILYISVRKYLFHRRSNNLSGGEWVRGRLNNFIETVRCLGLVKCFTIFHFNWNFWKFKYCLPFPYLHL